MKLLARFNSLPPTGIDPGDSLILRRGEFAHLTALSRFHYRCARPATICLILSLLDASTNEPAACLVVSRPTLNGWWRPRAWPGRFDRPDKRTAAASLNAQVRTISRVIVDPRYRGIGLARRLVRTYLDNPFTPCTEAIAVMGRSCPFFERAGMTPHHKPRSRRDLSLLRALRELRVSPSSLLATRPTRPLARALRTWANDARATRPLVDGPVRRIAQTSAAALLAPPIAYTHSPPPHRGPHAAPGGGTWPRSSIATLSVPRTTCINGSKPTST